MVLGLAWGWKVLGCLLFRAEGAQEPFQSTPWLPLCRCRHLRGVPSSRACGLDRGLAGCPTRNAFKAERPIFGHTLCHPAGQAGSAMCGEGASAGRNAAMCQEKTGIQCVSLATWPPLSAGRWKPGLPGSSSGQGSWKPSQNSLLARLSLV